MVNAVRDLGPQGSKPLPRLLTGPTVAPVVCWAQWHRQASRGSGHMWSVLTESKDTKRRKPFQMAC